MIHLALNVAAFLFLALVGIVGAVILVVVIGATPRFLELRRSRKQIEAGLADAEAGRLTPHADVVAMIQKRRQAK